MNVYSWGAKSNNALPTLEWRFNEISVPDGSSFKTTFTITPFHSLDRISGAAPSMVGTINYEAADKPIPSRVTATVISAAARGATAILRHRLLPVGNWQTLLTKDVTLEVDKPLSVTADFTAKSVGTHVFSLIIEKAGEELLDLEEPISIGEPKDDYVLRPKVQQPRTANTRVNVQYTSMDYETPHVKWARPYHRGKIKALVLIDGRYQREVIELAQRIDLDFDSTFLYRTEVGESLSDYYGKTTVDDLELGLARLLSENPDWQVLVMAGHMFRYFNEDQRRHVEQKIKDGAGLVVVQPDMTDPMPSLSPLLRRGDLQPRGGQWTRTIGAFHYQRHPVARASRCRGVVSIRTRRSGRTARLRERRPAAGHPRIRQGACRRTFLPVRRRENIRGFRRYLLRSDPLHDQSSCRRFHSISDV
jgi:hypothetical protein